MLPEDLLLVLVNEADGSLLISSSSVHYALAGAVLVELVNAGNVTFEADGKKLRVVEPTSPNAFLQVFLPRLDKPMRSARAVEKLKRHVRDTVVAHLVSRDVLRVQQHRSFLIFRWKTYEVLDRAAFDEVRKATGDVAMGYAQPDERTAALVSLLHAVRSVHRAFENADKREVRKRAKEIAAGSGDTVRRVVKAVEDAVAAQAAAASGA